MEEEELEREADDVEKAPIQGGEFVPEGRVRHVDVWRFSL